MAKMTAEKKLEIERAVADAAQRLLENEYALRWLDAKLGDWDFYGACGDDLTDAQYEKACQAVARKVAEGWIASLQKKGRI